MKRKCQDYKSLKDVFQKYLVKCEQDLVKNSFITYVRMEYFGFIDVLSTFIILFHSCVLYERACIIRGITVYYQFFISLHIIFIFWLFFTGSGVNLWDQDGRTPLMLTCASDQEGRSVEHLMQNGADASVQDNRVIKLIDFIMILTLPTRIKHPRYNIRMY